MNGMIRFWVFIFLLFGTGLQAQESFKGLCGTKDGKVKWLQEYQANPDAYPETNDTLYIPLQVHLIGQDNGNGFFSLRSLLGAFCTLQNDFKSAMIQFYLLDINYIANSTYYNHNRETGEEMMSIYKVEGALNCYIPNSPGPGLCGYSDYNLGVTMAKACVSPSDHTWAHEIGHFLSLPHPFLGWEGQSHDYEEPAPVQWDDYITERVDGKYCDIASDGFCDTPPDYLNFRWPCDGDNMSTQEQTDPNGEKFYADGTLIMSYAFDNCITRFSHDQGVAMAANLLTEKQDYFDAPYIPQDPVGDDPLVPISPAEGELVPTYQSVYFEWEPIPNATHYELQITNFEPFNYVLESYLVEGTSFLVTDLKANDQFWWRVRPFNSQFTCTDVTQKASFETGNLTSVQQIESVLELTVFPNPVGSNGELFLQMELNEAIDMGIQLTDVSGKVLFAGELAGIPGENRFQIGTEGMAPGLYLLQIITDKGSVAQKVIIR
jgi:hypothetical protein